MAMGLDYSFLHKTLKDPTRRDILRQLEDRPLTYVELMNRAKITNTGRFNYHLKVLADLIEKTDDGLYRLTDRGELALQLLDKFPEKTAQDIQPSKVNPPEKVKPRIKIPKKPVIAAVLVLLIGIAGLFAVSAVQTSNETLQIEWQQYLPGISGNSVIQTSDGGYLVIGQNASIGFDSSPIFSNYTSLVVKTDSQGNIVWAKDYSIEGTDTRLSLALQTSDGDYVLAGTHAVKTIYLTDNTDPQFGIATQQFCLIKIDPQGNILWNKTYVQAKQSLGDLEINVYGYYLQGLVQTSDGGYALVGSYTFDVGNGGLWFVKTDSSGNLEWNQALRNGSYASAIFQADDQGYIIVGSETSRGPSPSKYAVIKTDANGNVQWYKTYGGTGDYYNAESSFGLATDDGYVIVGWASPEGGAPTGWIVKTDTEGNMLWNKTYTYSSLPISIHSVSRANDGNLMFIGTATKATKSGEFDANSRTYTWIAQIDSSGSIQGQLGVDMGNSFTNPASIIQTADGGHVFVGVWNQSFQASIDQKFWIAKVADFQSTPSFYWLAMSLAIIIALALTEAIIAVNTWKRICKSMD